jgi:hypothetical protein
MSDLSTCYICDPFNPDANPEGCGPCDRAATEYQLERSRRLDAVTVHTRESTPIGPDFCRDCSEAISDWVTWPCGGVA